MIKTAENAEQDKTARTCRLILLYTPPQNKSVVGNSNVLFILEFIVPSMLTLECSFYLSDETNNF